ncbi:MAG TPA: hypothetical protein EYP51_13135, partial [Thiotrichales bacterium]|nr:hypothetical protein [Thiotrichales bacterium]
MLFPHRTKKFSKRREEGMADFIYRIILARISHHPSTATAQWHVLLDLAESNPVEALTTLRMVATARRHVDIFTNGAAP